MRRFPLTRKPRPDSSPNDILTGALNPQAWRENHRWESWANGGGRWASLVNLDHLKHFNDHQGLPMGDEALRLVGSLSTLHSGLNTRYSVVFRVAGEEFLILWATETLAEVVERSERLRQSVETSQTGVTITIVSTPVHTTDQPDVLLNRLRALMVDAKAEGRNRTVLDPELSLRTMTVRDQLLSRLCAQAWPEGPLLDTLKLSPTLDVLDVGAGDGRLLRLLRAQGHTGHLEGLDPAVGEGVRTGMAHALPYPDARFDVVLFVRALAHLGQPDAALAEARRMLRPGGRLVVAAHGPEHLRATWQVLGQEEQAREADDSALDIHLPVTVTAEDARVLAQSYGLDITAGEHRFPVQDTLHLRVSVQTT